MSELKPYICTQCGGKVNRENLICECCGTQFREEIKDNVNTIHVVQTRPGVHTLATQVVVDREIVLQIGAEQATKYFMEELKREFTKHITPFIEMDCQHDFIRGQMVIRGRMRVLDPTYRFHSM